MGCLWGAQIALHNNNTVHVLHHRQSFVDTVNKQGGIRMLQPSAVQEEQGDAPNVEVVAPVRAHTDYCEPFHIEDGGSGNVDCVIVMLKSHQTERAMEELRPILEKYADHDTVVCTLQNGIGNVETIMRVGAVRADRVLFGATTTFSSMSADGTIEHFEHRRPTNVWTACSSSHTLSPKQQQVIDCLRECGFHINTTPDARKMLWSKLAVNCSINTVTAICRLKIGNSWGHDSSDPTATTGRELMLRVAAEVATVARAEGIDLSDEEARRNVTSVAEGSTHHIASMCRDVLNKRKTEIDSLNGQVLHHAKKHAISVPATEHLFMLVKLIESNFEHIQ